MPNAIAYAALFAWPIVAAILFRRLPPGRALLWTILAGYLLLPEQTSVDLPLLPAFDKTFLPAAAALVLALPALRARGGLGLARGPLAPLVLLYLFSPFATVLMNSDPLFFGGRVLPGQTIYDAFSFGLSHAVLLLPFLLARRLLADEGSQRDLLTALAMSGLVYSAPALLEIRVSPQLHNWVYGFHPHSFAQQMRFGGFRPVVFLPHGLWLALFMAMSLLAVAALWRGAAGTARTRFALAAAWMTGVLVLCKTFSALAYAALLLPLVRFARKRTQALAAAGLGAMVLFYPMLRGADLAPTEAALAVAAAFSQDRAESLKYRLDNEDILLARANERPLLGWGGYGRNQVYDPVTGDEISVTDGRWIITIGVYGWLGYIAEFGLLTAPLIIVARRRRRVEASDVSLALGLILAANLADLIPNASLTPLTWLLAGALAGRLEAAARRVAPPAPARGEAAGPVFAAAARRARPPPRRDPPGALIRGLGGGVRPDPDPDPRPAARKTRQSWRNS